MSSTVATAPYLHRLLAASQAEGSWLPKRGGWTSVGLHVVVLFAVVQWMHGATRPIVASRALELTLEREQPPKIVPPPPPPKLLVPPPAPARALPRPAPVPVPRTVEAPAAQAESTPAPPPAPATPVEPPPPPPVAPAPAAKPVERVVTNDGIPSEYVNEVFARINRNTAYPKAARLRQQEGRVGYRLTLSPQGELLKFEIDSSGIDSLDEAARSAIHAAAPFPKLPDLGGTVYRLSGAIVFKLG